MTDFWTPSIGETVRVISELGVCKPIFGMEGEVEHLDFQIRKARVTINRMPYLLDWVTEIAPLEKNAQVALTMVMVERMRRVVLNAERMRDEMRDQHLTVYERQGWTATLDEKGRLTLCETS